MGKVMLVVVLLIGTIYGGIMLHLQNKMLALPQLQVRQLIQKEAESVSDYALRMAVRNSVQLGLLADAGAIIDTTVYFNNYRMGHCVIDSIKYTFNTGTSYRARSYIHGSLQGINISYPAEIAFEFPSSALMTGPNCFYLQMDQPQFNPSHNWDNVIDSSPNHNNAAFWGDIATRPKGQGANGWKCASFGITGGWIDFAGNSTTEVNSNFSIISFAKIRKEATNSTIIWMSSDPYDTATSSVGSPHPGQNLRIKPTAGIWYSSGNMYFSAVNTAYTQSTVTIPFVPKGKWPHNRDQWVFFGLTYNNGVLKAYIDGLPVGQSTAGYPLPAMTSSYGFSIGRRDLRGTGISFNEYMYMFGLIDQVGLYNRTLTDQEMYDLYYGILNPASMKYIRD